LKSAGQKSRPCVMCTECLKHHYEQLKVEISEKSPFAASAFVKAEAIAGQFGENGYCEQFATFNYELLRPFNSLRESDDSLLTNVAKAFSLRPKAPKVAFVFWNVVCFWIGIIDLILVLLLEHGLTVVSTVVGLVDGVLGYLFAYTFYFLFISTGPNMMSWMGLGLVLITLYVLGTGYLTVRAWNSLEMIEEITGESYWEVLLEIFLEGAKCAANLMLLYDALMLYCAQPRQRVADSSQMV